MYWAHKSVVPAGSSTAIVLACCFWPLQLCAQTDYEPLQTKLNPEVLEAENATIGQIVFQTDNVFDVDNPAENKWLYRLANKLHSVTRPHVVESQLLFSEGDEFSQRILDESERILRQNSYLRDAQIEPLKYEDGTVDLRVRTKDVWTLAPSLSAGRSGGENSFGIGLKEQNLFGTGVLLGFKYRSNVDRDTATFDYSDRNFRRSRSQLSARIGENSDGYDRRFAIARPFYALDTRSSGLFSLTSSKLVQPLYTLGEEVSNFEHELQFYQIGKGWSAGLQDGWAKRFFAGIIYDDNEFAPTPETTDPINLVPDDRRYLYPYIGVELVEDHYQEGVNFDQINIVEDRFLGTRFSFQLGYSSESLGSSANAWHFRGDFSNALVSTTTDSLVLALGLHGRYEDSAGQNTQLGGGVRYHHRWSSRQLFYASITGSAGNNLDLDNPLLLGGDTGLRGYPLRYQGGDSKALFTMEHRIFTEWYPFRLFNVGGAFFFDAGRTWGDNPAGGPNLGLLKDVGFGLRLGNNRSGEGRIIHIDIAFPLDGGPEIDSPQLLIDAKTSF